MLHLLFLVFGFIVVYSADLVYATKCGIKGESGVRFRIIGGIAAQPLEYPWQISLRSIRRENGQTLMSQHMCGGSIISATHVITAAHCVMDPYRKIGRFAVVVGKHDLNIIESTEDRIVVSEVTVHPNYSPQSTDYDIAILELGRPLDFDNKHSKLQPICLPQEGAAITKRQCYITGWGVVQYETKIASKILQKTDVPIVGLEWCRSRYTSGMPVTARMICAGYPSGGKGTCMGDSGGPLICQGEKGKGFELVGITSWGIGCAAPGFPGVYTSVSALRAFIKKVAGI